MSVEIATILIVGAGLFFVLFGIGLQLQRIADALTEEKKPGSARSRKEKADG